jgi:hypothetical protein
LWIVFAIIPHEILVNLVRIIRLGKKHFLIPTMRAGIGKPHLDAS